MKLRRRVTLDDVREHVWTGRCIRRYVAAGVELKVGDDGAHLVVQGARDRSVWPLDARAMSLTDTGAFFAYFDQQVVLALLAHAQPYRLYPKTVAPDEMAYLG